MKHLTKALSAKKEGTLVEKAKELGGEEHEEIVAFLYLGTREGPGKSLPALAVEDFVAPWTGPSKETP